MQDLMSMKWNVKTKQPACLLLFGRVDDVVCCCLYTYSCLLAVSHGQPTPRVFDAGVVNAHVGQSITALAG